MKPYGVWAVGLVVIGLVGPLGCSAPRSEGGAVPVVANPRDYQETLEEVQTQSQSLILAYDEGEALDEDGKRRLAEAEARVQRLVEFDPTNPALSLLLGKFSLALGDSPQAAERFTQALALLPNPIRSDTERALAGEAFGGLARSAENQRDWTVAVLRATEAITLQPKDPRWRTIRASAHLQLKQVKEARADLKAALVADPAYPRALQLQRLMQVAEEGA